MKTVGGIKGNPTSPGHVRFLCTMLSTHDMHMSGEYMQPACDNQCVTCIYIYIFIHFLTIKDKNVNSY